MLGVSIKLLFFDYISKYVFNGKSDFPGHFYFQNAYGYRILKTSILKLYHIMFINYVLG